MEQTKRLPYAIWTVADKEYKLKLTTSSIVDIENQVLKGQSLMNILASGETPSLALQLVIIQNAMKKYQHGMDLDDVKELFDQYLEEGGDHVTFLTDVFMSVFRASGFFPKKAEEKLGKQLENKKEKV